jgi:hypothetical protein
VRPPTWGFGRRLRHRPDDRASVAGSANVSRPLNCGRRRAWFRGGVQPLRVEPSQDVVPSTSSVPAPRSPSTTSHVSATTPASLFEREHPPGIFPCPTKWSRSPPARIPGERQHHRCLPPGRGRDRLTQVRPFEVPRPHPGPSPRRPPVAARSSRVPSRVSTRCLSRLSLLTRSFWIQSLAPATRRPNREGRRQSRARWDRSALPRRGRRRRRPGSL